MKGSAPRFAAACMVACLFSVAAVAAPPPATPPVTPGQVKSTLPGQTPPPTSGAAQVTNTGGGAAAAGVAPGGEAILVKGFDIEGNTVIPTSELQMQIATDVGKSLTLSELYDVADVLTRYYRSKGYGLADVSLPAQTLHSGEVRLQVIEGKLGKINFQGNVRTHDDVLQKRIEGLHSGDVYTDAAAERAVMLLDDLPGVGARAVLSPGQEFGSSDMLFSMDETHYSGDASVDDYGRSVIGRWRVNGDFNVNSLFGLGDQLGLGMTHADGNRLNFGKLSYALPVGPSGGTLSTSYNRAEYRGLFSNPGQTTSLPFSGSTQNAAVSWQYPEIRSANRNLYWTAGLSYDLSNSSTGLPTGGLPLKTKTTEITLVQLSTLYSRIFDDQSSFSFSGSFWTNGKQYSNVGSGAAGSGGGINATINQHDERARVEADMSYQQPFAGDWSFVGQLNASYSVNPLTDADKFNIGGPGSVLGYQSAEERGDSGYFLSTEVLRDFSWSPTWPMAWGMFLDTGTVWDKAGTPGLTTSTAMRSLTSGGLDLQLIPSVERINARLQWAYAIGHRPGDGNGGGHIWLTVGMTF